MSNRTEEPNVEEMLEKLRNMKFSGMAEELRLQAMQTYIGLRFFACCGTSPIP